MANIVDKYFGKKKKQIYEYCKSVNEFLIYDKNQIWKTTSELNEFLKDIISSYVDKYYFDNIENFEGYDELFGSLIKCDDKFKTIIVCTDNIIPKELKIDNYQTSIYTISLLIYTGIVLDRFTYPYNNYKINIKNVYSIIKSMFNSVSFIKFKENSKNIKLLTSLIKKNDNLESKFYKSLDELNTEVSSNLYESVDLEKKYYKTTYKYNISGLDGYRTRDVEKQMKRIYDDLNCLSYELTTTAALKSRMLNKDITILFPVKLEFYQKESEINKLFRVISNECIKSIIKFYVEYEDFKKNASMVRILSNAGFKIVLNFENTKEVPYGTFSEIKIATINNDFLEVNKGNIESWKNNGVEFVIKEKGTEVSELEMLGLKEEN